MERHIGEAARSADAMENIASKIEMGNKTVTQAYLTVNINGGTFQERNRVGQPDIKFAVVLLLEAWTKVPVAYLRHLFSLPGPR